MKQSKFLSCVILGLCLVLTGCGKQEPEEGAPVADVFQSAGTQEQTTEVYRGTLEICAVHDAWVAPSVRQLNFATQGKFGEYKVSIGDTVSKGQVLATLDPAPYRENIQNMEERIEDLTYNYEYNLALNEKTLLSYEARMDGLYAQLDDKDREWQEGEWADTCRKAGELDEARKRLELINSQMEETYQLEYSYLEEQLKELRKTYGRITITAPCDGTVIALYDMTYSEYTSDLMYYVAIAEKDVYCLRCEYISEAHVNHSVITGFRNGKEYDLTYLPMEEEMLIYIKNNGETRYATFRITDPDEDISYGDVAVIKEVKSAKEDVLIIPEIAIRSDVGGKYVYRKTESGREKVYITRGITNGIDVEITSGLEEGDVVYVQ